VPRPFHFVADAGFAGVGPRRPPIDVHPFEVVMAGEAGRTSNGSPRQIRKEAAL